MLLGEGRRGRNFRLDFHSLLNLSLHTHAYGPGIDEGREDGTGIAKLAGRVVFTEIGKTTAFFQIYVLFLPFSPPPLNTFLECVCVSPLSPLPVCPFILVSTGAAEEEEEEKRSVGQCVTGTVRKRRRRLAGTQMLFRKEQQSKALRREEKAAAEGGAGQCCRHTSTRTRMHVPRKEERHSLMEGRRDDDSVGSHGNPVLGKSRRRRRHRRRCRHLRRHNYLTLTWKKSLLLF